VIVAGSPAATPEIRILALGDSYTIGEAVGEQERWPVRLAALLRTRGIAVADPVLVAKTGWTTDELSLGIDAASPRGTFDVVTLLIGVNNQYRGRSSAEYREQFRALLERAVTFAAGKADHVVVLSIPDWGVTPFAAGRDRAQIAADIDVFNAINRDEALRRGSHYVDVTPVSRNGGSDASLVAADGLHPSGAMYVAWTDLALPSVLDALGRK
jgi:lysophospholipase L1-like esterase